MIPPDLQSAARPSRAACAQVVVRRALDPPSRRPREFVIGAAATAAEPPPGSTLLGPAAAAAAPSPSLPLSTSRTLEMDVLVYAIRRRKRDLRVTHGVPMSNALHIAVEVARRKRDERKETREGRE